MYVVLRNSLFTTAIRSLAMNPFNVDVTIKFGDSREIFELKAALAASLHRERELRDTAMQATKTVDRLASLVNELRLQVHLARGSSGHTSPTDSLTTVEDVADVLEARFREVFSPLEPVDAIEDGLSSRLKRLRVDTLCPAGQM
jgi:hypothetical protein